MCAPIGMSLSVLLYGVLVCATCVFQHFSLFMYIISQCQENRGSRLTARILLFLFFFMASSQHRHHHHHHVFGQLHAHFCHALWYQIHCSWYLSLISLTFDYICTSTLLIPIRKSYRRAHFELGARRMSGELDMPTTAEMEERIVADEEKCVRLIYICYYAGKLSEKSPTTTRSNWFHLNVVATHVYRQSTHSFIAILIPNIPNELYEILTGISTTPLSMDNGINGNRKNIM